MLIYLLSNDNFYTGMSREYSGAIPPANSTTIAPPEYVDGYLRKFDPVKETWSQVPYAPPVDERTLEQAKLEKTQQIDNETSAAIFDGFTYTVDGAPYHFSYDALDQQNFVDAASMAILTEGSPNPPSVNWNAYSIVEPAAEGEDQPKPTLVRLTLNPKAFIDLYVNGAMAHKATKMEAGGVRKEAVKAATTNAEVDAV